MASSTPSFSPTSGGGAQARMVLSVLPYRLRLVHLHKASVPRLAHELLRLVLFPSHLPPSTPAEEEEGGVGTGGTGTGKGRPRRFFSYCETPNDVSIVVEDAHVPELAKAAAALHHDDAASPPGAGGIARHFEVFGGADWRAIQVCEGAGGADQTGVVHGLSRALAEAGISVFFLSTFSTDFVLIEADNIGRAVATFRRLGGIRVEDSKGEDLAELSGGGALLAAASEHRRAKDSARGDDDGSGGVGEGGVVGGTSALEAHKHALFALPLRTRVCGLSKAYLAQHTSALVEALLYPESPEEPRLVSFTETEDELSLMMPDGPFVERMASTFPGLTLSPASWIPIQVGDKPLGFAETGIVASQSMVLAQRGLAMFYWSTWSLDYTLVREEDAEAAVEALSTVFDVRQPPDVPVFGFIADDSASTVTSAGGAEGPL